MIRTRQKRRRIVVLATFFALSACANVLDGTAGKTTDEALYEDAIKLMDKSDFTGAVAKFNQLSSGFANSVEVKENWAGALAGECGLNFINYTQQLQSASVSSTFFLYLMNAWTQKTITPASCALAERKMKEVWAISSKTASQQLFMAVLSMVKIGVYLRANADKDSSGNLGDGAVDAGFDACSTVNISNADMVEIAASFALFIQNIAGFAGSLSSDINTAISAFTSGACTNASPNICDTTDESTMPTAVRDSMRDFMKVVAVGIQPTCVPVGTDFSACCP